MGVQAPPICQLKIFSHRITLMGSLEFTKFKILKILYRTTFSVSHINMCTNYQFISTPLIIINSFVPVGNLFEVSLSIFM